MKGVVLAGGLGTRLYPLTKSDNKHLLPIYNKRMVELPIKTLIDLGCKDIIIVTGGYNPQRFIEVFKNGKDLGAENLFYCYQEGHGGIVDALKITKPFFNQAEPLVVILGDNYFSSSLKSDYDTWDKKGSKIFIQKVDDPQSFGIAEIEKKKIKSIEEKPDKPKSDLGILGLYFFDSSVWEKINNVNYSKRNELEIIDLLKLYKNENNLCYSNYLSYWSDMGTFHKLMEVSKLMEMKK